MARAVSAPDIIIRFATANDVALLLRFVRELAVFERAPGAVVATEADLLVRAHGEKHPCELVDGVLVDKAMGYFESVDSGSLTKRIVLGFGSGSAHLNTAVEAYLMTDKGLRRLGSGDVDAAGGKAPGVAVPLVMVAATGNPIGLIVSSAAKAEGELSGRTTIEGAAKRTAKKIADQLQIAFKKQGWI